MIHDLTINNDTISSLSFGAIDDKLGVFYSVEIFETEKEKKFYIKNIEKLIRTSTEYTKFIKYLRADLEFNKCAILNELTTASVSIELHHAPFTLYDLVESVVNKRIDKAFPLTTFSIAEEVMLLHYTNAVGLVPLSKTMHELVHSGDSDIIDKKMIIGNYEQFEREYSPFFSAQLLTKHSDWKLRKSKNEEVQINTYVSSENLSTFLTKVSSTNIKNMEYDK